MITDKTLSSQSKADAYWLDAETKVQSLTSSRDHWQKQANYWQKKHDGLLQQYNETLQQRADPVIVNAPSFIQEVSKRDAVKVADGSESSIRNLRLQLKHSEQHLQESLEREADLQAQVSQLQQSCESWQAKCIRLDTDLQEQYNHSAEQQQQWMEMLQQQESATTETFQESLEMEPLDLESYNFQEDSSSIEPSAPSLLGEIEDRREELQQRYTQLQQSHTRLQKQYAMIQAHVTRLRAHVTRLERDQTSSALSTGGQQTISRLQAECQSLREAYRRLSMERRTPQSVSTIDEDPSPEASQSLKWLQIRVQQLTERENTMQKALHSVEMKLMDSNARTEEAQRLAETMKRKIVALDSENRNLRERIQNILNQEVRKSEMEKSIVSVEENIVKESSDLDHNEAVLVAETPKEKQVTSEPAPLLPQISMISPTVENTKGPVHVIVSKDSSKSSDCRTQ